MLSLCIINAGQDRSAALDVYGRMWVWGDGEDGVFAFFDIEWPFRITRPYIVELGIKFVALSTRGRHSAALDAYGRIWTWGNVEFGALGHDEFGYTQRAVFSPRVLEIDYDGNALPVFLSVYASGHNSIAAGVCGRIWTWGNGYNYQLGHGNTYSVNRPKQIRYR
ncbi:MAG: hypothetical protein FWE03_05965 [Firmicutes bacterium]|nr:hypothetical protein [Bacillota bacterium]